MNKTLSRYQTLDQESEMVNEPMMAPALSPQHISPVDALWSLIMKQSRKTRHVLTERLLSEDMELGERLLLKSSIEKGWQQIKDIQSSGKHNGTLQDLINDLSNNHE